MPLRFYDNDDWRSPTSIRVYDNDEWKTASVGYVYDMGVWRVIFPDPITPSVSIALGPITYTSSVYIEFDLINADYIIVQLYLGSTQISLLQSQTIDTNHNITDRAYVSFSGLSGDTTYNIKVTAYSITENSTVFLTGSFITPPSVNLTAAPFEDLSGALISWTTTRQSKWRVIIRRTSDGQEVYRSSLDLVTGTTSSINAYFSALANTQYTVQLDLEFTGGGVVTTYTNFTTPNVIQPSITSLSYTSTCSSITANWAASNYSIAEIELWSVVFFQQGGWQLDTLLSGPISYGTSPTSHTFTGLNSQAVYGLVLTLTSSTGQEITSTTKLGELWIASTAPPSVTAPNITQVNSSYIGTSVALAWTASTASCTTISNYLVEYKQTSSSTWIDAGTTTFLSRSITGLSPNTSYDYRVTANTVSGASAQSTVFTSTTNNGIAIVVLSPNPASMSTFNELTITAQIQNASGINLNNSGVTINWTQGTLSGSSLSATSSNTNSSGQATVTFNTGSTSGSVSITGTAQIGSNPSGSTSVTVNLITGQSASLTGTATTKGASFNNNSYDSAYSYTNRSGYPTVGSLESGDSYNNSQFDILISRTRDARPSVSKSGQTATTTNTTFLANPLVSMAVTSSRAGYTTVNGPVAAVTAGVTITSRTYQWQQFTNSTWNTNFGAAFSGTTSQTLSWSNTTFTSRQIRCNVTTNFSNGESETSTSDNTVTIP